MNVAYYVPTIMVNLFSLGHLQRCGATYGLDPLRRQYIALWPPTGSRYTLAQQPPFRRL